MFIASATGGYNLTRSMPFPSQSGRPRNLPERPTGTSPEFEPETQPGDEDGVTKGMATLAVSPTLLENLQTAEQHRPAGDFAHMDDAAIMLELRAGNMAGFDYLIQKYRKPIVHF